VKLALALSLVLAVSVVSGCSKPDPNRKVKHVSTISTLTEPESVVFDKERDQFYVSQSSGEIALLSKSGKIKDTAFVAGLNHPRGMRIFGDMLYVADVVQLVEIDIPSKKIVKRYSLPGALFLNDVEVDELGSVYVSDTLTNQVAKLDIYGKFNVWLEDQALNGPNGLTIHDGWLYVASWGVITQRTIKGFKDADRNGKLIRVKLDTKEIETLSKSGIGNLDGIEFDGKGGFFVSDRRAGVLMHLDLEGTITRKYDVALITESKSAEGIGDIAYVAAKRQIFAPMAQDGSVNVLRLKR